MSMVIDIGKVVLTTTPSRYFIRKMAGVIEKQGQIEPLQVREGIDGTYENFPEDVHGVEIIAAAYYLGWKTLLVHVTTRYEE